MSAAPEIAGGFAATGAGEWLASRGQPVAFRGEAVRRRRKGWVVRDRQALDAVETSGSAWFADSSRPFLSLVSCAAPVFAVSSKVLVAPAKARSGAFLVKTVPMTSRGAILATKFENGWIVAATASRTTRIAVEDGETLSVRPGAVVAWTGPRPTGYVRRLGMLDVLLPRAPRDLMLHFHGPCIVWAEGSPNLQASKLPNFMRRAYGV